MDSKLNKNYQNYKCKIGWFNNRNTGNVLVLDPDNNKIELDCKSKICFKLQSHSEESSTEFFSSTFE